MLRRMSLWTARALHLAALVAAPLLLLQGRWVRARVQRLPAVCSAEAVEPADRRPRLLLLGESTAVGVGVDGPEHSLGACVAAALAAVLDQPPAWSAYGRPGLTVAAARSEMLSQVPRANWVLGVLVFGVNDTTGLTSPDRYASALRTLVGQLRRRHGPLPMLITGVPPLHAFPALPDPLRSILGWQSQALDLAATRAVDGLSQTAYAPLPTPSAEVFARDGFHPNHRGYAAWAARLTEPCRALLAPGPGALAG